MYSFLCNWSKDPCSGKIIPAGLHIFAPKPIGMICLKILKEKELVIMCFQGEITPDTVITFINSLVQEPDYNPNFTTIIDLRAAEMNYDMDGLRRTLEHMMTTEGFASGRRSAYITSNANQVVPPMMMNTPAYDFPMEVKVLSTVESAIDWLEIKDFTPKDYEEVIRSICDCQ